MDLKRLLELYESQFPHPWAVSKHLSGSTCIVCPLGDAEMGTWTITKNVEWEEHAEFIVELRNAFPLMVEHIKELEKALKGTMLEPDCWCDAAVDGHDQWCTAARKALKIETGST